MKLYTCIYILYYWSHLLPSPSERTHWYLPYSSSPSSCRCRRSCLRHFPSSPPYPLLVTSPPFFSSVFLLFLMRSALLGVPKNCAALMSITFSSSFSCSFSYMLSQSSSWSPRLPSSSFCSLCRPWRYLISCSSLYLRHPPFPLLFPSSSYFPVRLAVSASSPLSSSSDSDFDSSSSSSLTSLSILLGGLLTALLQWWWWRRRGGDKGGKGNNKNKKGGGGW